MNIASKTIRGISVPILEAFFYDDADRQEIQALYADYPAVQLELSALEQLSLFHQVRTLVLTGGLASAAGMEALYRQSQLQQLILDYEETDSDEEAINLSRFPELTYVLSRSNLNIRNSPPTGCVCEIINYYRSGSPVRLGTDCAGELIAPPGQPLLRQEPFLTFSAEAQSPAGPLLMDLLSPLARRFAQLYPGRRFSDRLDLIMLTPVCFPAAVTEGRTIRQRRLVSLSRRYADLRLFVSYEALIGSTLPQRTDLCRQMIQSAADYIASKDDTFDEKAFLSAIDVCLSQKEY